MLHLFLIWHFVGRLNIDTLTTFVTNKIDFKCYTLLFACLIPNTMKDIANINKPATHTHFIVNDILHNMRCLVLAE